MVIYKYGSCHARDFGEDVDFVDCHVAVTSDQGSYTVDPSLIPFRLDFALW